jgi:hypothetical protein
MLPKVTHVEYFQDFILRVEFDDGAKGEIDFEDELDGDVFEPLRDLNNFKQFAVHPELHTLVWPNGADFAPEFLYSKIQTLV